MEPAPVFLVTEARMFRQDVVPSTPSTLPQSAVSATVSAIEMARITGVGRERLRTWERRHGFPEPVRTPNGTRRYLASDVRRVVAAARAIEGGTAVADAIGAVLSGELEPVVEAEFPIEAALEHCDAPALALTGPAPLRVAWANRPTVAAPESPAVGSELLTSLPDFGGIAVAQLQSLMMEEGPRSVVIEHRDWTSTFPTDCRSLAWRLPPEAAGEPTVVLMQLPDALPESARPDIDATSSWTRALSKARTTLTEERGLASVQRALGTFLRSTGGIDGFLATCQGDRLRTATSVAGAFSARAMFVEPGSELAHALQSDRLTWLGESAASAMSAPARSRTLVVPLAAGGDRIGAAFLLYPAEIPVPEVIEELILAFGTALALTLQREHLAGAAAAVAAAAPARVAAAA